MGPAVIRRNIEEARVNPIRNTPLTPAQKPSLADRVRSYDPINVLDRAAESMVRKFEMADSYFPNDSS